MENCSSKQNTGDRSPHLIQAHGGDLYGDGLCTANPMKASTALTHGVNPGTNLQRGLIKQGLGQRCPNLRINT